ncbi:hypothetical protein FA15DRAFT_663522 [Coprinopsis marcescibilis]|uniref:Uncharacterized protein n=1 Tax=Coprinopsis marcescibilis TaxID=230819 RepID=A0A5C3LC20_COPMA|nr:hypothetical protein FA15DRAFT_663522 [Coprinopsis marcescibilis]
MFKYTPPVPLTNRITLFDLLPDSFLDRRFVSTSLALPFGRLREFFKQELEGIPGGPWIMAVAVLFPIFWMIYASAASNSCSEIKTWAVTDALTSVFPPARYSQSGKYRQMLASSVDTNASTILLRGDKILEYLVSGEIEVKDKKTLQQLLSDQLCVHGWKIVLRFDWEWMFFSFIRHLYPRKQAGLLIDTGSPYFDLDQVAPSQLPSAIRQLLKKSGSKTNITIGFTCLDSSIGFLDDRYNICSLLFDHSQNLTDNGAGRKTLSPLFMTPKRAFDAIHASLHRFEQNSIKNMTDIRAKALEAFEHDLTYSKQRRTEFVFRHGIRAWRQKRTVLAWEAGLLKAAVLQRWEIEIRLKSK